MTAQELKVYFRKGKAMPYAWPGGYPLFYLCSDGGVLCPSCVTKERAQIFRSTHEHSRDGWAITAVDANWEDPFMLCDHCGKRIESAYAEDSVTV
jgi:hypothetical protein